MTTVTLEYMRLHADCGSPRWNSANDFQPNAPVDPGKPQELAAAVGE